MVNMYPANTNSKIKLKEKNSKIRYFEFIKKFDDLLKEYNVRICIDDVNTDTIEVFSVGVFAADYVQKVKE